MQVITRKKEVVEKEKKEDNSFMFFNFRALWISIWVWKFCFVNYENALHNKISQKKKKLLLIVFPEYAQ